MAAPHMGKAAQVHSVVGSSEAVVHSFSEEEKVAFAGYINSVLQKDPELSSVLPINTEDLSLFESVKDGLLICKLINDAIPDTIDERALNKTNLNPFRIHENQNLCINSSKAIGCSVVNIGAEDLMKGKTHLVLGLLWQIIRIGLFSRINLVNHPELHRLLEEGETIDDFLKLSVEDILLRWFNYHLKNAGWHRQVSNFTSDIKDSENYTVLLSQIAPEYCNRDGLNESDLTRRAEMVLDNAEKIDCRKFVTARDICRGHPKLNLAFVANMFNTWPALEPVEEVVEVIQETREEKTFRNWMNSLGVEPFVTHLYSGLEDGTVLLQLFEKIAPSCVNERNINRNPTSTWKKIENLNYAVLCGKQLKFSLIGIQGKDIMDQNKTLTLGLVWQMMRHHVLSILIQLGGGKAISDDDIIAWAQQKVAGTAHECSFTGYKDATLSTSKFILALIDAIQPDAVNWEEVSEATDEDSLMANAKYAISLARKIGATVFALPEDIVEVQPKMLMTLFAGLMAVDLGSSSS